MGDNIKRIAACALGLASGALLLCGNTVFSRLPKNVHICGVEVGGMDYNSAARAVRKSVAESVPRLTVYAPDGEYVLSYPQISFTDNFYSVARGAKRGGDYSLDINYCVAGLDELIKNVCAQSGRTVNEAYFEFDGAFTYYEGAEGVECNAKKLKEDIIASVGGSFSPVTVECDYKRPASSVEELKEKTRPLGSFTTYFDGENANRKHNITLAAAALNGSVVDVGEEFSFNLTVGARTAARGYKQAKIISEGKYVTGTGGGVCQVSTTLYNAALLSGMCVTRVKPHSLCVGYVEPSFDAMVSSSSDFRFVNSTASPVYIACAAGENFVTARLYGVDSGIRYVRESSVVRYIEPEECLLTYGDEDAVKVEEKRGLVSVGYLSAYRGEEKLYQKEIRRDSYKSVRGERVVKRTEESEKN